MLRAIKGNKWLSTVAFLAIGLSLYMAVQYFVLGADQSGLINDKLNKMNLNDLWYAMLYIHIVTAIIAICTGWPQFIGKLRARSIRAHRAIGKIYSYCVLLGGVSGIYLSFYATGGWVSSAGFLLLALLWIYTLIKGIRAITVNKDTREHQRWMTRNYALTFAAVTLRIYLPLSMAIFGFESFDDYYRAIAWLCWVPNLIFAQWLVNRSKRQKVHFHSWKTGG
ncbi:DUF2306 domain-containing protein [Cohnella cholangitidis]|uniref:DUF2306 domain-containing protein n=1 Tax=Cohnella cholangitidis TaxID=2598458 RepID=A0A7G5BZN9_9BACL|nr:DUF2306 domain-containing protein [Cohnella cholangitidis]QMV42423.1 DUF2306 domain-containing protein [Cohnella cholangitidis]